ALLGVAVAMIRLARRAPRFPYTTLFRSLLAIAVAEHVENAGVHSGDATVIFPPQKIYLETVRRIRSIAARLARALRITGPFNVQFLAVDNEVMVLECNLLASGSFTFVFKVRSAAFM